jgi:hypothetical protein
MWWVPVCVLLRVCAARQLQATTTVAVFAQDHNTYKHIPDSQVPLVRIWPVLRSLHCNAAHISSQLFSQWTAEQQTEQQTFNKSRVWHGSQTCEVQMKH